MSTEKIKENRSILRTIVIGIIVLPIFGFLIDLFSGFYVLRTCKSIYAGVSALFLLALVYIVGEAGSNWINSKDDSSHPLYKRVFHLVMLLIYVGIIMISTWLLLSYFIL
jgi:hypothetical protein